MIELVLFQEFHTGDILLNKEIVRNIIVCNPNLKVYYVTTENCYSFYSDVKNVHLLNPVKLIQYRSFSWKIMPRENNVYINLHCQGGPVASTWPDSTSLLKQQNRLITIINQINNSNIPIKINYNTLTEKQLLPRSIQVKIPESIKNKLAENKKRIFYYNVISRSGQYSDKKINHDFFLNKLCSNFKDYCVIVPKKTDLNYPNLLCLDNSGITVKPNAENILQYAQIAKQCQDVILIDCGACWPSLINNNDSNDNDNNTFYIIREGSNTSFSNIVNKNISIANLKKEVLFCKELIKIDDC